MTSTQLIRKYIRIYVRKWAFLWLFCATICALPIFITALRYNVLSYDIYISAAPFIAALLLIFAHRIIAIRFERNILMQEQLLSVSFSDEQAERIADKVYLSRDWLICLGKCALHRQYIKDIFSEEVSSPKTGTTHQVIVDTVDDRSYTLWIEPQSSIEKINDWLS